MSTNGYESEFAAPDHTIVDVRHDGARRQTTVILNDELVTFEVDETVHRQGALLADKDDQQNDGGLTWQM